MLSRDCHQSNKLMPTWIVTITIIYNLLLGVYIGYHLLHYLALSGIISTYYYTYIILSTLCSIRTLNDDSREIASCSQ